MPSVPERGRCLWLTTTRTWSKSRAVGSVQVRRTLLPCTFADARRGGPVGVWSGTVAKTTPPLIETAGETAADEMFPAASTAKTLYVKVLPFAGAGSVQLCAPVVVQTAVPAVAVVGAEPPAAERRTT